MSDIQVLEGQVRLQQTGRLLSDLSGQENVYVVQLRTGNPQLLDRIDQHESNYLIFKDELGIPRKLLIESGAVRNTEDGLSVILTVRTIDGTIPYAR